MNHSVWKETAALPAFPPLDGDTRMDVLIIGGGLAGILCAHMLAKSGVDYTLIEADRICSGVTQNTTAKITSQHGLIYDKLSHQFDDATARMYWDANESAIAQYRTLSRDIPCDLETKNAFVYSKTEIKKLEKELETLERLRIPAAFKKEISLPFSVAGAIKFPHQAQFNPQKFVSGIANGLRIFENTAAQAFKGNTVLTNRGTITAKKIILTTHFPIINKHGAYFLKMYQHRSYVLALENAPAVDGMYVDEAKTGLSFRNYGNLLLLGGGSHRTGKQGGNWTELEAFAKTHYPDAKIKYRWATQDCMTLDGIPYIGQYSKHTPDLYTATGFNKWGMTASMVAAMILSDMVQGIENPYATVFSPSRSILRPQLMVNAVETTLNLLTPTKPRCPHLGCALKWNPLEHTWDCPCHGSRFTQQGKLINNPANDDLSADGKRG